MGEILISWDHLVAIMTADVAFRSWNALPFLEPELLTSTLFSVPGQHAEHDVLAAVWAELRLLAAVVFMEVHLVQAHGQLAELALNRALLAFLGLVTLQRVLRHALLTHGASHLLVPALAVFFHLMLQDRFLAFWAEDQIYQAVGLMEAQVVGGHPSFAVPAHLQGSLHVLISGIFLFQVSVFARRETKLKAKGPQPPCPSWSSDPSSVGESWLAMLNLNLKAAPP